MGKGQGGECQAGRATVGYNVRIPWPHWVGRESGAVFYVVSVTGTNLSRQVMPIIKEDALLD
jgi:hypothetical protein